MESLAGPAGKQVCHDAFARNLARGGWRSAPGRLAALRQRRLMSELNIEEQGRLLGKLAQLAGIDPDDLAEAALTEASA